MYTDHTAEDRTRFIKASEFKAKCLKLMDEIAADGGEIVITKHGRPVLPSCTVSQETGESLWH